MCEKFQALLMEICIIRFMKPMLAHSASKFVQRILLNLISMQVHHPNHV